jgi:hypothetical protein
MDSDEPGEPADHHTASSIRVTCECGGSLGLVTLPYDHGADEEFQAVCAGCGTRYHWRVAALFARAGPGKNVLVVLPRSCPHG